MKWIDRLEKMNACAEAIEWAKESGCQTLAEARNKCQHADWMLWYIGRAKNVGQKKLVLCVCEIARLAGEYVPKWETRPRVAVETAEAWARGDACVNDVYRAASASYTAAATNATASASYAAIAAAYTAAAAHAAAIIDAIYVADAAYAAAYATRAAHAYSENTERKCADIVRKHFKIKDIMS